jgi:hypothetical protein
MAKCADEGRVKVIREGWMMWQSVGD